MKADQELASVTPPPPTRGPGAHEAAAARALFLLESCEWVGPPQPSGSRRGAEMRAYRLVKYLEKAEPRGHFKWRTWQEKEGWRWAVKRSAS